MKHKDHMGPWRVQVAASLPNDSCTQSCGMKSCWIQLITWNRPALNLCHLSWFIHVYPKFWLPAKYIKTSPKSRVLSCIVYTYIPFKLDSKRCSSSSPWNKHGPTPPRLLHGSLPWHLLRRWHTPGKDHPQRAHAEAPPLKSKALKCDTWQSVKYGGFHKWGYPKIDGLWKI